MLKDKIENKESGIILYGITPPKQNTPKDTLAEIAKKQINRISSLPIDALVLYDIQDESSRTTMERPFPFIKTMLPQDYSSQYLPALKMQRIIYQSVGKHNKKDFEKILQNISKETEFTVFVGAPSHNQQTNMTLNDAYAVHKKSNNTITVGGVAIPERHASKGNEHLRIITKMEQGCRFFITQCVYSTNNSLGFLSDLYYYSKENNIELVPIIFTLTPCGSLKTLEFMKWLGIDIPHWLNNELIHSENILEKSLDICRAIAQELITFCKEKNIPIGFNIESIAIRKEEIEASIQLLKDVKKMLR